MRIYQPLRPRYLSSSHHSLSLRCFDFADCPYPSYIGDSVCDEGEWHTCCPCAWFFHTLMRCRFAGVVPASSELYPACVVRECQQYDRCLPLTPRRGWRVIFASERPSVAEFLAVLRLQTTPCCMIALRREEEQERCNPPRKLTDENEDLVRRQWRFLWVPLAGSDQTVTNSDQTKQ